MAQDRCPIVRDRNSSSLFIKVSVSVRWMCRASFISRLILLYFMLLQDIRTSLLLACESGQIDVVKKMISNGVSVEVQRNVRTSTCTQIHVVYMYL